MTITLDLASQLIALEKPHPVSTQPYVEQIYLRERLQNFQTRHCMLVIHELFVLLFANVSHLLQQIHSRTKATYGHVLTGR